MPAPVQNLLNTSIGIQSLLQMPDAAGLPNPVDTRRAFSTNRALKSSLAAATPAAAPKRCSAPDIGDGRVVSPEVFESHLTAIVAKLQASDNPKIKALLENEILPIMQNGMLLSAYRGLMLGG